MAGIYIHIPFCRQKCHYCNFFSLASRKHRVPFLNALEKEIAMTRDYLRGEHVETIYFGGGTPSLFSPAELQRGMELMTPSPGPFPKRGRGELPSPSGEGSGGEVLHKGKCSGGVVLHKGKWSGGEVPHEGKGPGDGVEITLELNPDDATEDYVAQLKNTWFNRFSIGVQSFCDDELQYLNRTHSAEQAVRAVKLLQEAGYGNISIDLIFGLPGSSNDRWEKNLETAFSLGVPHISAYALTVESRTPLAWMIGRGKTAPVSDESQANQFRILMRRMKEQGYLQYEISNFCQPDHFARHNTNYWKGVPYLGLGPSAHSYNGTSRRWNVSNLSRYIEAVNSGILSYEEEVLTPEQKFNEYVMTSLRTMWGTNLRNYELRITNYELIKTRADTFVRQGLLMEKEGIYYLTDEGKLFADGIAAELFVDSSPGPSPDF